MVCNREENLPLTWTPFHQLVSSSPVTAFLMRCLRWLPPCVLSRIPKDPENPVVRRMPLTNLCNRLVVNEHPTVPSALKWGACRLAVRPLLNPPFHTHHCARFQTDPPRRVLDSPGASPDLSSDAIGVAFTSCHHHHAFAPGGSPLFLGACCPTQCFVDTTRAGWPGH